MSVSDDGLTYLAMNEVAPLMDELVMALVREKPENPKKFIIDYLQGSAEKVVDNQPTIKPDQPKRLNRTKSTVINAPHATEKQPEEELYQKDFEVEHLPNTPYPSPLLDDKYPMDDTQRVLYNPYAQLPGQIQLSFEHAGPHSSLHFNPKEVIIGIVSCGGLCPGLNDVIRALTIFSTEVYGVKKVIGFKYGYSGICDDGVRKAVEITQSMVRDIHRFGGSFLGSSRGHPVHVYGEEMAANLKALGINILFTLGGDGTMKGARDLGEICKKQGLDIAIVGIPKTIDNDICFVQKTFGFETAVNEAVIALKAAQAEARSAENGVGLVKLMGRHSGFVAAQAAIAFGSAHIVLIPENEVKLETIFKLIEARFKYKKYCVILVAEGFGQNLLNSTGTDASGNKKLGDIGVFLKVEIEKWLKANFDEYTIKYIDPSYMIRSCPATTNDAAFCLQLANHAVHQALHGATSCLIGFWNNIFTAVPISLCVSKRKNINLTGDLWRAVREITVSTNDRRLRRRTASAQYTVTGKRI